MSLQHTIVEILLDAHDEFGIDDYPTSLGNVSHTSHGITARHSGSPPRKEEMGNRRLGSLVLKILGTTERVRVHVRYMSSSVRLSVICRL